MDKVGAEDGSQLDITLNNSSTDDVSIGISVSEANSVVSGSTVDIMVSLEKTVAVDGAVDHAGNIEVVVNHEPPLSVRTLTTPLSVTVLPAVLVFVRVVVYCVGVVPGASGIGLQGIWQDFGKVLSGTRP